MQMDVPVPQIKGFVNGVDVGKLEATLAAVNNDPELARFPLSHC